MPDLSARQIDWRQVRAEFPITARCTYLNTASYAPLPRRAVEQGQRYYTDLLLDADAAWPRWEAQRERVRAAVARLLGAAADDITLTAGASHAFSLIAAFLGPPGHVVAMADEFPRVTVPFRRAGYEVALIPSQPDATIDIGTVVAAIRPGTRAVIASTVMHATGFRQDVGALAAACHARGVPLVVDASQAVGVVPLDVLRDDIDVLAFAGYKGTMGGHGSGALYVRRDRLESAAMERWREGAAPVLELGQPPLAGVFALGGGIALLEEVGLPRVEARVHQLTDFLHARLEAGGFEVASPRPPALRAGITIVRMADAAAVVSTLRDAGIIVSARGAGIRVSLHLFNSEEDIDRLVHALG